MVALGRALGRGGAAGGAVAVAGRSVDGGRGADGGAQRAERVRVADRAGLRPADAQRLRTSCAGNALVSQVQALSSLVDAVPGRGGVLRLRPARGVLLGAAACFIITAALECFIKLEFTPDTRRGGVWELVRGDLAESWRFMLREQPGVLKLLLLAGVVSMFLAGRDARRLSVPGAHGAGAVVRVLRRRRERGGRGGDSGRDVRGRAGREAENRAYVLADSRRGSGARPRRG